MTGESVYLLVDNGSIRPASTLVLRRVATEVGRIAGAEVLPISLDHSNRVAPEDLGGKPAVLLSDFLVSAECGSKKKRIVILPVFLGNRGAIVRRVESVVEDVRAARPDLKVKMARFLFEEDGPGQEILATAVAARVREKLSPNDNRKPVVVLTDHGSPLPIAAQVRNFVAGQVQMILRDEVHCVVPASMERRKGKSYAFTDPLLEEVLRRPVVEERPVILAMFFLLPGRHAGEGGDVAEIRDEAIAETGNFDVRTTELLADHPLIISAFVERVREG